MIKKITDDDFILNERNEKLFKLKDQNEVEIVYNYTLSKVHSYGGNINTD